MKLLASMAAEINRRSHIFGCSPSPYPRLILALKVVLVSCSPYPSCVRKFWPMCIYDDGNSVFRAKKTNICNAQFRDLRIVGTGCTNLSSKVPYLESPTLIYLSLCNVYGATMMIKGSLLLNAPIVKRFRSVPIFGQNLTVLGDK